MTDSTFAIGEPRTEDEYRTAIELVVDEIKRLHEHSAVIQSDIERISHESRMLREQIAIIKARTQVRLEALDTLVPA
jgi:hypothetical protein